MKQIFSIYQNLKPRQPVREIRYHRTRESVVVDMFFSKTSTIKLGMIADAYIGGGCKAVR